MKNKKNPLCPICNKKSFYKLRGVGKIIRCSNCGFGRLNLCPPLDDVEAMYNAKAYFGDKNGDEYYLDALKRYKFISRKIPSGAKILDFGCGMGQFIGLCRKGGYRIKGYDISKYVVNKVNSKYGFVAKSGKLSKRMYKQGSFDVITSFDVIEHVWDFEKAIDCFNYWLKPGGYLYLSTPNIDSWDAKLFSSRWHGYTKLKEHLVYFSPKTINILLKRNGFYQVSVKQWGFVRSIGFAVKKMFGKKRSKLFFINDLVSQIKLDKLCLYFPMHNMLIIAQKTK